MKYVTSMGCRTLLAAALVAAVGFASAPPALADGDGSLRVMQPLSERVAEATGTSRSIGAERGSVSAATPAERQTARFPKFPHEEWRREQDRH